MSGLVEGNQAPTMGGPAFSDELTALTSMSIDALRAVFRKHYRRAAPDGFSRDLIARLVVHRLQELRLGKLDPDLGRHLNRLGNGKIARRRIKTGSVLVREYDGVTHEVVITPDGFLWKGETHASLSLIARRITGTTWNGPRFFGLRQAQMKDLGRSMQQGAA